jgi:hypothetical protein
MGREVLVAFVMDINSIVEARTRESVLENNTLSRYTLEYLKRNIVRIDRTEESARISISGISRLPRDTTVASGYPSILGFNKNDGWPLVVAESMKSGSAKFMLRSTKEAIPLDTVGGINGRKSGRRFRSRHHFTR